MGAPTSAVLAEIYMYIHHIEHKQIYLVLIKQQINGYFRYVDDMFIIYGENKTNIEHTLGKFSKLQPFIKFRTEKVLHKFISFFLDLTVHRENKNLKFSIYRKPIQTDIILIGHTIHTNVNCQVLITY